MKIITHLIIAIVILSFQGCDETKKVIDVAGSVQLAGTYDVTSVGESNVKGVTISFNALDKTIRGNGGCNSYFGNYTLDLYALSFSDIGATEMYCDEAIMTVENAFMESLKEVGSYTYKDGVVSLLSKNDRSVLIKAKKQKTQED